jgi:hypothetical protein
MLILTPNTLNKQLTELFAVRGVNAADADPSTGSPLTGRMGPSLAVCRLLKGCRLTARTHPAGQGSAEVYHNARHSCHGCWISRHLGSPFSTTSRLRPQVVRILALLAYAYLCVSVPPTLSFS